MVDKRTITFFPHQSNTAHLCLTILSAVYTVIFLFVGRASLCNDKKLLFPLSFLEQGVSFWLRFRSLTLLGKPERVCIITINVAVS